MIVRRYGPFDLNIPRMGYIILYKHNKGWIGRGIRKMQLKAGFTKEEASYTHVEISGGGPYAVYVGTPQSGVVDIQKKYKGRSVRICALKQPVYMTGPKYWRKLAKVAFWAATHCNLRYDFFGVLAFVGGLVRHSRKKYFCSENALWAIHKEFPKILDIADDQCMPAHFTNEELFPVIWEGTL